MRFYTLFFLAIISYNISSALEAPKLLGEEGYTPISNPEQVINWTNVSGADAYRLTIHRSVYKVERYIVKDTSFTADLLSVIDYGRTTKYYVQAIDSSVSPVLFGPASDTLWFSLARKAPNIISPNIVDTLLSQGTEIEWEIDYPIVDFLTYELVLSADTLSIRDQRQVRSGNSIVLDQSGFHIQENVEYELRVRVLHYDEEYRKESPSHFSESYYFRTDGWNNTIENPKVNLCGSGIASDDFTLTWDRIEGADAYSIRGLYNNDYDDQVFIKDTFLYVNGMSRGMTLLFEVSALQAKDSGDTLWSEPTNCGLEIYHDKPQIISDCGIDLVLNIDDTLRWEGALPPYPYVYNLEIYDDTTDTRLSFYHPLLHSKKIGVRAIHEQISLKPNKRYFWRVRLQGYDWSVGSEFSDFCTFTTGPWGSVSKDTPKDDMIRLTQNTLIFDRPSTEQAQIYDLHGRLVLSGKKQEIYVGGLTPGAYFVVTESGGSYRFVKSD